MNKSLWSDNIKLPKFEQLKGHHKTDILIIGGGICGILCAYFLKNSGIDYMLVEGNKICNGTTKNTTAKITSQHGLIYNKLVKSYGVEQAQRYLKANEDAVKTYAELADSIPCDFEIKKAYTYSLHNRKIIEKEVRAVNRLGFEATFGNTKELPFQTAGAICFNNQAQFNPLKFVCGISKDLNIYENTFIYDVTKNTALFMGGSVKANKIIITTHFPFINRYGAYFLKLYQHISYVAAYAGLENLSGMYVDEDLKGLSLRSYKNYLLVGGGSHRTGKKGGGWHEIDNFAKKYYSNATQVYQWAAQDCISLDGIAYIGNYSKNTPDMYVATGFNKWGITSSMVAAKILIDMAMGRKNEYEVLFSPERSILKPRLLVNGLESTVNLLTPTGKRCSHLGCALKWNKYERSWDCSCHGSRFTKEGIVIDNPAQKDISD